MALEVIKETVQIVIFSQVEMENHFKMCHVPKGDKSDDVLSNK